jgi:hypothetical protein
MATLFFDGFDRATFTKQLDPKYWSTEYNKPGYPRYAFGGYTYVNQTLAGMGNEFGSQGLSMTYSTHSVNNGTIPSGTYYNGFFNDVGWVQMISNSYPGFGTTPGFLALTNVPINDSNNLEFISYIQLSGFPPISGTRSYFGLRTLGIETKHLDYHNVSFPAGRFGNKHPFLAFCSGNFTGVLLSIVQITGDHLLPLKMYNPPSNTGIKRSIGLQVEQHNGISGVFDLNLSDTLPLYRITPLYTESDTNAIPSLSNDCKILTIATDDTTRYQRNIIRGSDIISRWTHFEFEFDHIDGGLKLKVEGSDALVENTDIYTDRDLWDIEIKISGFKYDNIRLFNRTYDKNAHYYDIPTLQYNGRGPNVPYSPVHAAYYARGQLTLFDDITLVDNTGNDPKYYLGPDAKVLPLTPGVQGLDFFGNNSINIAQNGGISDGLREWTPSMAASDRRILLSMDKDASYIATDKKQSISTVIHSAANLISVLQADSASYWRGQAGEAVGGLKIYNSARKNFLDSSFINVVETGIDDPYREHTTLLMHNEEDPVRDYSKYNHSIAKYNTVVHTTDHKFDTSGIAFYSDSTKESFLIANTDRHPENNAFTVESWVKFTGVNDTVVLMDTQPRLLPEISTMTDNRNWYRISCNPSSIKIENPIVFDIPGTSSDTYDWEIAPETSQLILPFSTVANTGEWHHIALVKANPLPNTGQYIAYLNGVSGTTYQRLFYPSGYLDGNTFYDSDNNSIHGHNGNFAIWYPSKIISSDIIESPIFFSTEISYPYVSVDSMGLPFLNMVLFAGDGYFFGTHWYNKVPYPSIFIGYSGIMDEYRYTKNVARYTANFDPPTSKFKANYDDHMRFGPIHATDRSSYRLFQFYQMVNPGTNQPWTSGEIFTSGIRLGVEKL